MKVSPVARAAYRMQHRLFALQGMFLGEMTRMVVGVLDRSRAYSRRGFDPGQVRILGRRFEQLLNRDLENAAAGFYPPELLFQMPLSSYARRVPHLLDEARRAAGRARRRDFFLPYGLNLEAYPAYYRRTFHWQPDGYLSERSAKAYDLGVEVLFGGTADVMRRQTIPPIARHLAARERRAGLRTAPPNVLDLACGTGRTLIQLARARPDLTYVAIDLSRPYLQEAERLLRGQARADFLAANAEFLPFAPSSFDLIVCVYLFHELPLPARRRVLAEARRVLAPDGLMVLEDACQLSESPELEPVLRQFPRELHEPYFVNYLHYDLADLASDAGFDIVAIETHLVSKVVVARPSRARAPVRAPQAP